MYTVANGRFNGKCKACGTKVTFLNVGVRYENGKQFATDGAGRGELYENGEIFIAHECTPKGCNALIRLRRVIGKYNPGKKCSAKCLAATGHDCECECGGKNHGAGN